MTTDVLQVIATDARRGAEIFAVDLHTALVDRGRAVRTVALKAGSSATPLDVSHLGRRSLGLTTLLRLRRQAALAGYLVAHGSSTLPACAAATVRRPSRFIYRSIGDPTFWRSTATRRWRVRLLLEQARTVVALWPGAADSLTRHGLDGRRVVVIPNAVPATRFPLVTEQARAAARGRCPALRTVGDARVILSIGSLSAEKRVDLAVLAVGRVPEAHLIVVGDGPLLAELEELAAVEAPGRVHFLGTTADSAAVLALADMVLLSSATEGMPAVLIEAGLSGLPVVSTDVGGVREVVVPEVTGLLVPPGDPAALAGALQRTIDDPPPAGAAARAHCAGRFDIGVVAAAWDELLAPQ